MIYAVNKRTKEHRLVEGFMDIDLVDLYGCRVVEANDDGWIEWSGDECPLPDNQRCEIKDELGEVFYFTRAENVGDFDWRKKVTRYRPILDDNPQPPKRDGEGLPPVGTYVKIVDNGLLHYGAGERGPVVAHVENCAVVCMSYGLGCFQASVLRPIRTEREEWVDRALYLITPAPGPKMLAEAIYDALKSGELPQP